MKSMTGKDIKEKKFGDLLIILPAYNEAANIAGVLKALKAEGLEEEGAHILVIDDASQDSTGDIARESGCRVITHPYNMGYGCGLQTGYKFAVRRDYSYIIQMDADGQHDAANVCNIYETLKKSSHTTGRIVLGSRFVDKSKGLSESYAKHLARVLFRGLIYAGTGKRIMDPTTGLQGLDRRAFEYYSKYGNFDDLYPDANMIMQMCLLGFEIEEIPAVMHERINGKSMHSGIKPFSYMIRMCFSVMAAYLRVRFLQKNWDEINNI